MKKKGVAAVVEKESIVERLEESFPPALEEEEATIAEEDKAIEEKKEPVVNNNKKKKKKAAVTEKSEDELLAEAINTNKECRQQGCKQGVTILGRICSFCGYKFCLNHRYLLSFSILGVSLGTLASRLFLIL